MSAANGNMHSLAALFVNTETKPQHKPQSGDITLKILNKMSII